MKKFLSLLFAVILVVFVLSSCSLSIKNPGGDDTESDTNNNTGINPGENELPGIPLGPTSTKTTSLQLTYAYDHITLAETGEKIASLLVAGGYLNNGFGSVELPKDCAAGDIILIRHTGEIVTQESYPSMMNLKNGTLKSYSVKYAEVIHLTGDEINAQEIRSSYDFAKEYVIIDKTGRCVTLDEFKGTDLYLVKDQERIAMQFPGVDSPLPIACMLAYNPRG